MKIRLLTIIAAVGLSNALIAQINSLEKGTHHFGVGLNGGITVGDYEDIYSSNIGLDLFYLYGLSNRFLIGGSTGFASYFGKEINLAGIGTIDYDDAQFIPLAASLRFSPFKNFIAGADIGYAFGINEGNDGGFYASPRATYMLNGRFPLFVGYRLIDLDEASLGSLQFGLGYKF